MAVTLGQGDPATRAVNFFIRPQNKVRTTHKLFLLNIKIIVIARLNSMTPTHQALLPGRCSRITGQVVQQAVEVVRLGPLNRTAGCHCKQGFLTLAKMHVKHRWNFDSICFFPEITIISLYIDYIYNNKMLLVGLRAVLSHLAWKEQIRTFDVEHANCWANKGGWWSGVGLSEVR